MLVKYNPIALAIANTINPRGLLRPAVGMSLIAYVGAGGPLRGHLHRDNVYSIGVRK
jgi:hypothetical protein